MGAMNSKGTYLKHFILVKVVSVIPSIVVVLPLFLTFYVFLININCLVFSHIVWHHRMLLSFNTNNRTRNYSPREEFGVTQLSMKCRGGCPYKLIGSRHFFQIHHYYVCLKERIASFIAILMCKILCNWQLGVATYTNNTSTAKPNK